jgi:hypothetical protein
MRLALAAGAALTLISCDMLPATTDTERSFRACEEVIKSKLDAPSTYKRLWADFTERGPITKEEYILRLEQIIAGMKPKAETGDFGAKLTLYTIKQQHRCAKTGKGCNEFGPAETAPGEEPAAEVESESGNPLIYENSSESKAVGTSFVLLEYQANNQFNAPLRAYHFCRMLSPTDPYLDGVIPLSEGDAAKKLYEKL